jgi:hypothetical protein
MNLGTLSFLATLALPCSAGGDTLPAHAGANVHARDGPDAMRSCEILHDWFGVPVECSVSDLQGYPSVVLTFLSTRSMDAHGDIVSETLVAPFCAWYAPEAVSAQVVFRARDTRLVSVFGCDTGTFSDWTRLTVR